MKIIRTGVQLPSPPLFPVHPRSIMVGNDGQTVEAASVSPVAASRKTTAPASVQVQNSRQPKAAQNSRLCAISSGVLLQESTLTQMSGAIVKAVSVAL